MPTLEDQFVDYIETSGAALTKTAADLEVATQKVAAYDSRLAEAKRLLPAAVEAGLRAGLIAPNEKQAFEATMLDPVRAIQFVTNAANEKLHMPQRLGGALPKQASDNSAAKHGPRVLDPNGYSPAADAAYRKALGLS